MADVEAKAGARLVSQLRTSLVLKDWTPFPGLCTHGHKARVQRKTVVLERLRLKPLFKAQPQVDS